MSGYAATNGAAYEHSMGRWSRKLADSSALREPAARACCVR
jgi:hypothetical protein